MPVPASTIAANAFYQPAAQWEILVYVKLAAVNAIEEAFEDIALSLSSFEKDEDQEDWNVSILTETKPEKSEIEGRLVLASGLMAIATPEYQVKKLEAKDWVTEVERSFPPLSIGRFYVHGSHVETHKPVSTIMLQVNAGAAFGSGEHATTSGCLLALSNLAKKRKFNHVLDMGCGSGILAIAAAKLWHVSGGRGGYRSGFCKCCQGKCA